MLLQGYLTVMGEAPVTELAWVWEMLTESSYSTARRLGRSQGSTCLTHGDCVQRALCGAK